MPPIVAAAIGANHNLPTKTTFARDCVVTLRSPLESRSRSAHSRRVEQEHHHPDDTSPPSGTDLSGEHGRSGAADVPSAASLPPPFPTEGVAAPSRPGEVPPPAPQCLAASVPSCPPPRNILAVLSNIDHVNSTLGAHKLKASEALLELALDKDHDKVERRKCATAILRAPFQRYPSAAAINGPTPPKPKRRKNDDDDDRDGGDDDGDDGGDDDQPPSAPEDLMRAYDHGYWNGCAIQHWPKPTAQTVAEATENYAAHAPGRVEPLQPDNLPELPHSHRHARNAAEPATTRATSRRFLRRSARTPRRCRGLRVLPQATRTTHLASLEIRHAQAAPHHARAMPWRCSPEGGAMVAKGERAAAGGEAHPRKAALVPHPRPRGSMPRGRTRARGPGAPARGRSSPRAFIPPSPQAARGTLFRASLCVCPSKRGPPR